MAIPQPISQTAAPQPGENQPTVKMDPQAQGDTTGDQQEAPVEFDIHVKAVPSELMQAVDLLKEAGLDDLASQIEKAVNPEAGQEDLNKSTNDLTDEISAMGNNPHSGMTS